MQYKSVKGYSALAQFGILCLFLLVGFILAAIVQLGISMQMLPKGASILDAEAITKAMMLPQNVNLARLAQVAGTFFLLCIPAILYSWVTNGRNLFLLGFNKHIHIYQVLLGFAIIYAANIMAAPIADLSKDVVANFPNLNALAKKLEAAYNEQVLALSNLRSWPEFLMAVVIMAFFPALLEELFFRGALQNILVRWIGNAFVAILITSIIFSLIHMSVYLFVSRIILGFVLGLMYHKTKNIWVNVIAHFLNNAIAVGQLFWLSNQNKKIDVSMLDPKIEWWLGLLAAVALVGLFWLLQKISRNKQAVIAAEEKRLYALNNTSDPFHNNNDLLGAK